MEIRASFDAATLNLAANVAKSDGESIWGWGWGVGQELLYWCRCVHLRQRCGLLI